MRMININFKRAVMTPGGWGSESRMEAEESTEVSTLAGNIVVHKKVKTRKAQGLHEFSLHILYILN